MNKLSVVFKKLNLTLRLEGAFVIGARPADAAAITTLEASFGNELPKYAWSNLKIFDKSTCPAAQ